MFENDNRTIREMLTQGELKQEEKELLKRAYLANHFVQSSLQIESEDRIAVYSLIGDGKEYADLAYRTSGGDSIRFKDKCRENCEYELMVYPHYDDYANYEELHRGFVGTADVDREIAVLEKKDIKVRELEEAVITCEKKAKEFDVEMDYTVISHTRNRVLDEMEKLHKGEPNRMHKFYNTEKDLEMAEKEAKTKPAERAEETTNDISKVTEDGKVQLEQVSDIGTVELKENASGHGTTENVEIEADEKDKAVSEDGKIVDVEVKKEEENRKNKSTNSSYEDR